MIIYKITNTVNGKIYIGCTTRTIEVRLNAHFRQRFSATRHTSLGRSICKYGIKAFIIEKIEDCLDEKNMFEREVYWINYYRSTDNKIGYNLTKGGDTGPVNSKENHPMWGKKNEKLSALNKSRAGVKLSEEHKQKVINTMIGKKRSEETKKKMSESRKSAWANGKYNNTDFLTPRLKNSNGANWMQLK